MIKLTPPLRLLDFLNGVALKINTWFEGATNWIKAYSQSAVVVAAKGASIQAIPTGAWTQVTLTASIDPTSRWDAANNRFIADVAGYYEFFGQVGYNYVSAAPAVQGIYSAIYKNGVQQSQHITTVTAVANYYYTATSIILYLDENDYVELYTQQNSGGSSNLMTTAKHTYLTARLIRPIYS